MTALCATGAYVSMMPATTASLTKDMRQLGHRTSLLFLIVSVFALTVRRGPSRVTRLHRADLPLRVPRAHPSPVLF